MAGDQNDRCGSVAVPQYRKAGHSGSGKSVPHTKGVALPGKRQCDFQSLLYSLKLKFYAKGGGMPKRWTQPQSTVSLLEKPTLRGYSRKRRYGNLQILSCILRVDEI